MKNNNFFALKKTTLTTLLVIGTMAVATAQNSKELTAPVSETFSTMYNNYNLQTKHIVDGNGDGTSELAHNYGYDTAGRKTHYGLDNGSDGQENDITTYSHNADGTLDKKEIDNGNDGSINTITRYTYNAKKERIRMEQDHTNDGTVDYVIKYEYDVDSRQIKKEEDNSNDGTFEKKLIWGYDAAGNKTTDEVYSNGILTASYNTTYNAQGKLLTVTRYTDGMSANTTVDTYTYDANGNKIMVESDANNNGTLDGRSTWTYNATNQVTSRIDKNLNTGDTTRQWRYEYKNNRLDIKQYYIQWVGKQKYSSYDTIEYNSNDLKIKVSSLNAVSHEIYNTKTWSYNSRGQILKTSYNSPPNPNHAYSNTYQYDINGNRTLVFYERVGSKSKNHYIFKNPLKCYAATNNTGLAHHFKVTIPSRSDWTISLCGTTNAHSFALSKTGFCDAAAFSKVTTGCSSGSGVQYEYKNLDAGDYYLTVVANTMADTGPYKLTINTFGTGSIWDNNEETAKKIITFPNPTSGLLTIRTNKTISQVSVINVNGMEVMQPIANNKTIDVSSLPMGVYFLIITTEGNAIGHSKFIKH